MTSNQDITITSDTHFFDVVERGLFVDSPRECEALFTYAMTTACPNQIMILWLLQQNNNLGFTHNILKDVFLEHANIDQVLFALKNFLYKPTSFFDRVLSEGTAHQINELNEILGALSDV